MMGIRKVISTRRLKMKKRLPIILVVCQCERDRQGVDSI